MPECHKCQYAAAVAGGKFKSVPYEQTPCHPCRLSEDQNNHGRSHVSMDSCQASEHEAIRAVALSVPAPVVSEHDDEVDKIMSVLATFLRSFMSLSPQTRDIVAFRVMHPEKPLRQVAKRMGFTVQSAHQRMKQAIEKWPALATVIRIQDRRQRGDSTDDSPNP